MLRVCKDLKLVPGAALDLKPSSQACLGLLAPAFLLTLCSSLLPSRGAVGFSGSWTLCPEHLWTWLQQQWWDRSLCYSLWPETNPATTWGGSYMEVWLHCRAGGGGARGLHAGLLSMKASGAIVPSPMLA